MYTLSRVHGTVNTSVILGTRAVLVKAKFHYAILVADRSEAGRAGRRPAASWNLAYDLSSELARASRSATGLRPAASGLSATRI